MVGFLAVAVVLIASIGAAQFGQSRRAQPNRRFATLEDFDGSFQFCRLVFRNSSNGDGGGWGVDYPRADENLSIRIAELTRVPVSMDEAENPNHLLVRLGDPVINHCPFVMMTEPGGALFDAEEVAGLRDYVLRGGFLWADDFWGEYAWDFFENQIRRALPSSTYPVVDLPLDHPIFHAMLNVSKVPQIPSINAWGGPGGRTSERRDSAVPHVRAINDEHGRIMVLFTHNTDFGDSYEREADDPRYFEEFSVNGYAFGINTIIYAMTH
jgi:hypothetical protein